MKNPSKAMNREVFVALWENHKVPTQRIADAMGVTRQAVGWHAKKMGLPSREKLRRRLHDPDLLAEMYLAGVSAAEIAKHFGMAHHSCAVTAARKLNLPKRQRGPSGKMNGGWPPTISAAEFFLDRAQGTLGRLMAHAARIEQAALINAEMADWNHNKAQVGARHARGAM